MNRTAQNNQTLKTGNKEEELFLKNAHLFYRNAEQILSDRRMYYTPIHIQNGMTYRESSGAYCPTLGMYIEWWQNCKVEVTKDREGNDALTYRIAGNPLTGTNSCMCVYPDGHTSRIVHKKFFPMWSMFKKISKSCCEADIQIEAYTLEEAVNILSGIKSKI